MGAFQLFDAIRGEEVVVRHQFHTALARKAHGTLADQHHVMAGIHHQARQPDGIGDVGDRRHRPGRQVSSVHDGGVHLHLAVLVEHRTAAGVEQRIVLQQRGAGLHRLQGIAAPTEDVPAVFQDAAHGIQVTHRGLLISDVVECPRPTVDHQGVPVARRPAVERGMGHVSDDRLPCSAYLSRPTLAYAAKGIPVTLDPPFRAA